jgi:hypothetical protein
MSVPPMGARAPLRCADEHRRPRLRPALQIGGAHYVGFSQAPGPYYRIEHGVLPRPAKEL